jgi:putative transposase
MKADSRLHAKINAATNKKKKKSYKKARRRIKTKITNKTKDLHYKAINFLGQYENIFLPTFPVKQLAAKGRPKTNSRMYALSHFMFKLRLAAKTAEFHNKVIICNESYTSKTCTGCGVENHNLGKKKIFECDCGILHDRDYNGARNIALRVLTQALSANRGSK